jgi:hypothetical protein
MAAAWRPSVTVRCQRCRPVLRVGERRLRAERDLGEIDTVLRVEACHGAGKSTRLIEDQCASRANDGDAAGSGVLISRIRPSPTEAGALPGCCWVTGGSVIASVPLHPPS